MDHELPPAHARLAFPDARLVDFGPPPGVGDDECAHAFMLVTPQGFGGEMTRVHRAFFKPTADDLEALNAGGHVVVNLIGQSIQPFGCMTLAPGEFTHGPDT